MPIISYPVYSGRCKDMNVETSLLWQFGCFLLCGVFLSVGYEFFRIIRIVIPHNNFFVGAEDIIYLSFCGLILFGLSMEIGSGYFRLLYLLSAVFGAAVYFLTVGRLVKIICIFLFTALKKFLLRIFKVICSPLKKVVVTVAHNIAGFFVRIHKNISDKINKASPDLKNDGEMLYNNYITDERNEIRYGGRIEAKIKKIQ